MPTPEKFRELYDGESLYQRLERMRGALDYERSGFIDHYKVIADVLCPRRPRFYQEQNQQRGQRVNHKILDNTATLAWRVFRSGFMAANTSPASPWFRLTLENLKLAEFESVKLWLYEVTNLMRTIFVKSNLYKSMPSVYGDLGAFGTPAMLVEEDFEDVIRTYVFPVGSFMIAQDDRGKVNTFFREFTMTVSEIVAKFGRPDGRHRPIDWTNISEAVKTLWQSGDRQVRVYVCHAILPNDAWDPQMAGSEYKQFLSVYYEKGSDGSGAQYERQSGDGEKYLRISGYDYFPVLCPRWEVSGEDVYSTNCPGMEALGDTRQLQKGESKALVAINKMVDPPVNVPTGMENDVITLLPGDRNFVPDNSQGVRPVHEVVFDLKKHDERQERCRERINETWYKNLFISLLDSTRRQMTAREVEERHQEKLLAVGPVLASIETDFLAPLIDITFAIMERQGLLPEPPEEIQGMDLKVEFISIMAQAAKLAAGGNIERFLLTVAEIVKAKPEAGDKLDFDNTIDALAEVYSVPPDIVISDEKVALIREARAELQARQESVLQAQAAAKAAKDLSGAKMGEDTALDRVLEEAPA